MAIGVKQLIKLQMGRQASLAGGAVAATSIWRGMGSTLDDSRKIEIIDELIGIFNAADRTQVVDLTAGLNLEETPLTFEQLPYLFAMGMGLSATGVQDGSGTDYIYTATMPTTAVPTANLWTWQTGDNNEAERMPGCFVKTLNISGKMGQTARMKGEVVGQFVEQNAFTGSLSVPTVEEAITSKGKLYIDAIGGTYGTTQVSSQLIAFELAYNFLWTAQLTMTGLVYFDTLQYGGHEVTGSLTFLHDTGVNRASGQKLKFANQTAQKVRLDLIGGAVGTPGTTYSTKHAIFDLPMKYTKVSALESEENNNIVTLDFQSRYNLTSAEGGKAIIVNEISALP